MEPEVPLTKSCAIHSLFLVTKTGSVPLTTLLYFDWLKQGQFDRPLPFSKSQTKVKNKNLNWETTWNSGTCSSSLFPESTSFSFPWIGWGGGGQPHQILWDINFFLIYDLPYPYTEQVKFVIILDDFNNISIFCQGTTRRPPWCLENTEQMVIVIKLLRQIHYTKIQQSKASPKCKSLKCRGHSGFELFKE